MAYSMGCDCAEVVAEVLGGGEAIQSLTEWDQHTGGRMVREGATCFWCGASLGEPLPDPH